LPVAFAVADLSQNVGWKARLRAAERLTAAGAMPAADLLRIMRERQPAASGGIWDRVAILQDLAEATDAGNPSAWLTLLPKVWAMSLDAGYSSELAIWIAPMLNDIPAGRQVPHVAMEIGLLAGRVDLAARFAQRNDTDKSLLAIAEARPFDITPATPLAQSIRRALSGLAPSDGYLNDIDDGRPGEALLNAMIQLAPGAEGDPNAIGDALAVLTRLGLNDLARQVATEIMIEASRI
jgi:hypothetical protein